MSRCLAGAAVVLLGLAYIAFFQTGFSGWCFSGRAIDIDIRTGRQRVSKFLFGRRTEERVTDTWLSQSLPPDLLKESEPDWRRTSTIGWFDHNSPTYRLGGCYSQIRDLEEASSLASFAPSARRSVSLTLLSVWQQTESYRPAHDYVQEVCEVALKANERGTTVDESDLPQLPNPR